MCHLSDSPGTKLRGMESKGYILSTDLGWVTGKSSGKSGGACIASKNMSFMSSVIRVGDTEKD